MSIHSFRGVHHPRGMNFSDPAGLGVPFTPFTPAVSYPPDSFHSRFKVAAGEEKEEKFTADKAVSSFVKGMVQPFVEMVKHPIKTLAAAAALGVAAKKIPGVGKYLALAGLVIGGLQFLTGMGKAATGVIDGNAEEAEAGFKSMGSGTTGVLFSKFASKQKANAQASPRGVIAEIKDFVSNLSNNLRGRNTNNLAQVVKTDVIPGTKLGLAYQVPFATYYGNGLPSSGAKESSEESSKESTVESNPSRANGLDWADEIYKGNYDFKTEE